MKTTAYNPSKLEKELANILVKLQDNIEEELSDNVVKTIKADLTQDNPAVLLKLIDVDGDAHEVVLKIIQRPDK